MKHRVEFDIEFRKNPYKGCFIALEGIDGSGKSTQATRLKKAIEETGKKVEIRHPFEGEIGKFVRTILAGKRKVTPIALQYLISANRAVQQEEIIKSLSIGNYVIIDRYYWSAVAYGMLDYPGLEKKDSVKWLLISQSVLSQYHQFISPDFTFYLDISSKIATKRIDKMGKEKEIYENEAKIKKIENIYEWLVSTYDDEFIRINGDQVIKKVTEELITIVSRTKKKV